MCPVCASCDPPPGDQPRLDPHVSYYQRLLAGDHAEAEQIASIYATTNGMERLADDVLVAGENLCAAGQEERRPYSRGRDVRAGDDAAGDAVGDPRRAPPGEEASATEEAQLPGGAKLRVLGCPAHHRSEELALLMVKAVAEPAGCQFETVTTRTLPVEIERMVASEHPSVLFIAILPPGGVMQARYLCGDCENGSQISRLLSDTLGAFAISTGCWWVFDRRAPATSRPPSCRAALRSSASQSKARGAHCAGGRGSEDRGKLYAGYCSRARVIEGILRRRRTWKFMDRRIGKLAAPGVILALLVLLANAWLALRNVGDLVRRDRWVEHTQAVLSQIAAAPRGYGGSGGGRTRVSCSAQLRLRRRSQLCQGRA